MNKKASILLGLSLLSLVILLSIISVKEKSISSKENEQEKQIFGGIVSHHLLVEKEIDKFFSKFEGQDVKTVVIVGPNHFGLGEGGVITTESPFATPFGNLDVDVDVTESLLKSGNFNSQESPFEFEHSITSLTGFVKRYMPDAKIVPIIIKTGDFKESTLDELADNLHDALPEKSIVIASVDFSHHLSSTSADFHDELSVSVIGNFDFPRIKKIEVDSPASIYLTLKLLEKKGAQKMFYSQTNSSKFLGNIDSEDTTSYLFAHFLEGVPFIEKKISILSFGDAMFGRDVRIAQETGLDVFKEIRGIEGNFLRGYDLATLNLEGPITNIEKEECQSRPNVFRFSSGTGKMLFENNISAVNLANNHIVDCFKEGIVDTKKNLKDAKVGFFMSGFAEDEYFQTDVNGKTVVFIGLDTSLNYEYLEESYLKIQKLKNKNNILIVNLHGGIEYEKKSSNKQSEFAHKLIDNGADVIIGHHPHVTQEVEIYKDKAIFYSLGNFIFDQALPGTDEGFAVGSVFGEISDDFYIFPYRIDDYTPKLLSYDEARIFCDELLQDIPNRTGCHFFQNK